MGQVLGIVYRAIATHQIHKAGYTRKIAHTGAVSLIQRFGRALNLNIYFHILSLDGVYLKLRGSVSAESTSHAAANSRNWHIPLAHRVGRYLERQGWLVRDAENSYLALETADDDPFSVLQGHSITYRIALGPQAWRKVFSLQSLPPVDMDERHSNALARWPGSVYIKCWSKPALMFPYCLE